MKAILNPCKGTELTDRLFLLPQKHIHCSGCDVYVNCPFNCDAFLIKLFAYQVLSFEFSINKPVER